MNVKVWENIAFGLVLFYCFLCVIGFIVVMRYLYNAYKKGGQQ
jgi:hypothetical protein